MEQVLINFRLVGDEAVALRKLCGRELRKPAEQIRWLLQKELEKEGYLKPVAIKSATEEVNYDNKLD